MANTGVYLSKTIILTELHFHETKWNLTNQLGSHELKLEEAASVDLSLTFCSMHSECTEFSKDFQVI